MKSDLYIGRFDDSLLKNADEFTKRYEGTYLLLDGPDVPKDFYRFVGFAYAEKEIKYLFKNDHGNFFLNEETNAEIHVKYPKTGYFNTNKNAIYVARIPNRQWKRGLCKGNIFFHDPLDLYKIYAKDVDRKGSVKLDVNENLLRNAVFDRNFPISIEDWIKRSETRFSTALNYNWALGIIWAPSAQPFDYVLMYHGKIVGYLEDTIFHVQRILATEFADDFYKFGDSNKWQVQFLDH